MTLEDLTEVVGVLQTEVARLSRRVAQLEQSPRAREQRKAHHDAIEALLGFYRETQQHHQHPEQP